MGTPTDSYDESSDTLSGDTIPDERTSKPPIHRAPFERGVQGPNRGKRTPRPRKLGNESSAGRAAPPAEAQFSSPVAAKMRGRGGLLPGRNSATASPVISESSMPQEAGSAQKRKRRRLAYPEGEHDTLGPEPWRPGGHVPTAGRGRSDRLHGDIGEGVSALLSLASVPGQDQGEQGGGPQPHASPSHPHGGSRGDAPVKRDKRERRMRDSRSNDVHSDPDYALQHPVRPGRKSSLQPPPTDPDGAMPQPSPSRHDTATSFQSPIKTNSALEPPRSLLLQAARRGDAPHPQLASPPLSRRFNRSEPHASTLLSAIPVGAGDGPGQPALAASILGNRNVMENQSAFWAFLNRQSASGVSGGQGQPGPEPEREPEEDDYGYPGGEQIIIGRRHKRKPVPERLPVTLTAAKYAFTRSMMPSTYANFNTGSGRQQQQSGRGTLVDDAGEPMSNAELVLRHCLSSRVRRWCAYEFHCSAIDRPFFLRNELQEFLHHLGIAHVTSLTRTEWSIIRSAFGKPRRFSAAFLRDEREKLEAYRQQVRNKYQEVGVGMEVPPDLPRPLRVEQAVTARHPQTRQLHDGSILTVTGNKYRVQFNRSDLLTEVVPDVDVMPVDPSENLPLTLASLPLLLNGRMNSGATGQLFRRRTSADTRITQDERTQEKDARALLEITQALDVKEALLRTLKDFHDAVAGGSLDRNNQQFQTSYAHLLLQLKDVDKQVQAALRALQDRPQLYATALQVCEDRGHPAAPAADPQQEATAIVQAAMGEARALVTRHCTANPSLEAQQAAAAASAAMAAAAAVASGLADAPATAEAPPPAAAGPPASESTRDAPEEAAPGEEVAAAQAASPTVPGVPGAQELQGLVVEQRKHLQREEQCLAKVISGCMGMLYTVQKCTAGSVGPQTVGAALDLALTMLQPRASANQQVYHSIAVAVANLKQHLTAPAPGT